MTVEDEKLRRARRRLREDERDLWRSVTRTIRPLPSPHRTPADPERAVTETAPEPSPRPRINPPPAVRSKPASKPAPVLAPIERRAKQRLARGVEAIDARIDLHGKTQSAAHSALLRFLRRVQADGARYVLVITGKGVRADDAGERGVLKRQVPQWLGQPEFRELVVGFEQAGVGHGGEGALYVRIRRRRK